MDICVTCVVNPDNEHVRMRIRFRPESQDLLVVPEEYRDNGWVDNEPLAPIQSNTIIGYETGGKTLAESLGFGAIGQEQVATAINGMLNAVKRAHIKRK